MAPALELGTTPGHGYCGLQAVMLHSESVLQNHDFSRQTPWIQHGRTSSRNRVSRAVNTSWNKDESLSASCCRNSALWDPMKLYLKTSYFSKKFWLFGRSSRARSFCLVFAILKQLWRLKRFVFCRWKIFLLRFFELRCCPVFVYNFFTGSAPAPPLRRQYREGTWLNERITFSVKKLFLFAFRPGTSFVNPARGVRQQRELHFLG